MFKRSYLTGAVLALAFGVVAPDFAKADAAIAIGRDRNGGWWYGVAWNHPDEEAARADALRRCRAEGPNCKIETSFRGGCAALAFQSRRGQNGFGWAVRDTIAIARRAALDQCVSTDGIPCDVKSSFCDNG